MKKQAILLVATMLSVFSLSSIAQQPNADTTVVTEKAPGKAKIARATTLIGTVEAIDVQQRVVTLKGSKGNLLVAGVHPDVRDLDQVKVGDRVAVRYAEALTLTLKKDGKELRSSSVTNDSASAPAGQRPAGVAAEQILITADVTAVNTKTQTVTLRGPKQTVDLLVPDPAQLKLIKVGDQIQAEYLQAVALSIDPAPTSKKK